MTNNPADNDLTEDHTPTHSFPTLSIRRNGRINFADLLTKVAPQKYPTKQQAIALTRVRSAPNFVARVIESAHRQYCEKGYLIVRDASSRFDVVPCPYCQQVQRKEQFQNQLKKSGIDGRYLDVEWDDLVPVPPVERLAAKCQDITKLLESGASLLLYGKDTGTGKTQCAMLIAKAALRAGYTVRFFNLGELAMSIRASYGERNENFVTELQAFDQLVEPDLLIIDDLGAGEADSLKLEKRLLYHALNQRHMHRKATIYTSNMIFAPSTEDMQAGRKSVAMGRAPTLVEVLGERIVSRLQTLTTIHFNHGRNFRVSGGKSEVSW